MRPPASRPKIDEMITIAPPPRARIDGTTRREARIAGNSVWSKASCQSASLVASRSPPRASATLFTSTSTPPKRSMVASTTAGDAGLGGQVGAPPPALRRRRADAEASARAASAERLFAARRDAHVTAFGDQRAGAGQAEPAARPGDDRDLALQSEIHRARDQAVGQRRRGSLRRWPRRPASARGSTGVRRRRCAPARRWAGPRRWPPIRPAASARLRRRRGRASGR